MITATRMKSAAPAPLRGKSLTICCCSGRTMRSWTSAHRVDGDEPERDGPEERPVGAPEPPEGERAAGAAQREEPRGQALPAVEDERAHGEQRGAAGGGRAAGAGVAAPDGRRDASSSISGAAPTTRPATACGHRHDACGRYSGCPGAAARGVQSPPGRVGDGEAAGPCSAEPGCVAGAGGHRRSFPARRRLRPGPRRIGGAVRRLRPRPAGPLVLRRLASRHLRRRDVPPAAGASAPASVGPDGLSVVELPVYLALLPFRFHPTGKHMGMGFLTGHSVGVPAIWSRSPTTTGPSRATGRTHAARAAGDAVLPGSSRPAILRRRGRRGWQQRAGAGRAAR